MGLHWRKAPHFYLVIAASSVIGILLNFLNINPIQALDGLAVINGILVPFLLIRILLVATGSTVTRGQRSRTLQVLLSPIKCFFSRLLKDAIEKNSE